MNLHGLCCNKVVIHIAVSYYQVVLRCLHIGFPCKVVGRAILRGRFQVVGQIRVLFDFKRRSLYKRGQRGIVVRQCAYAPLPFPYCIGIEYQIKVGRNRRVTAQHLGALHLVQQHLKLLILFGCPCEIGCTHTGLHLQVLRNERRQVFVARACVQVPVFPQIMYAYRQASIAIERGRVSGLLQAVPRGGQRVGGGNKATDILARSLNGSHILAHGVDHSLYRAVLSVFVIPPVIPHPLAEVHLAVRRHRRGDGVGIEVGHGYLKGWTVAET